MTTQTDRARQACVAYYHRCTSIDDWGTMPEDWVEVITESPAPGYMNRYFQRNETIVLKARDNSKGVMVVTILNDKITDTEWFIRPFGDYRVEGETYYADDSDEPDPVEPENHKPEGYGVWA